jgi:hypothetical protein
MSIQQRIINGSMSSMAEARGQQDRRQKGRQATDKGEGKKRNQTKKENVA